MISTNRWAHSLVPEGSIFSEAKSFQRKYDKNSTKYFITRTKNFIYQVKLSPPEFVKGFSVVKAQSPNENPLEMVWNGVSAFIYG